MLETLAKGFRSAKQRLSGVAELTDEVIDEALRDVRMSLLEADVEFRVTKRFLERVREQARGERIRLKAKSQEYGVKTITPEQGLCKDLPGRADGHDGSGRHRAQLGQEGSDRYYDGRPSGIG